MVTVAQQNSEAELTPVWEIADAGGGTWTHDPMHFPRPITPLFESLFCDTHANGFTTAAHENAIPLKRFNSKTANHYYFNRVEFLIPRDEAEAQTFGARAEAAGRRESARMMERWETEHLPRIRVLLTQIRTMDAESASRPDAMVLIDEIRAILTELWVIHFRIAQPMMATILAFVDFHTDLFGGSEADAHDLLLGRRSKSVEAGIGLSDLARDAREAGLASVILETPVDDLHGALAVSAEGRDFLGKLTAYLDQYGLRQDLFELDQPTWQEDPRFALASVQTFLRSGHDAAAEHEQTARNADAALASALERLASYPQPIRDRFAGMAQAARAAAFLQEEHNFYIDQQGFSLLRYAMLGFGRRLVAQRVIDNPEDIFMLTIDEIKAIVAGPVGADRDVDVRAIVAQRRDEMARAARLTPPPFIGTPPGAGTGAESLGERAMMKFFGGPPQQADAPNQLKGNAGSRGVTRGVARVALTLDEAKTLQTGEILVTTTTMPAWTPLFGTARAVVTETGGSLSHCAIVAREYGIPAVVGAFGATRAIKTGDLITVDGDRGVVILGADAE
jgi:pyruvate,water dikinase